MTPGNLRIFLDTSVVFAAVLSPTGGARKLFHLAEAGLVHLTVGLTVLREADEVVRRKIPTSLPLLAQLLDAGCVEISPASSSDHLELAQGLVQYAPDAHVLAEAICAEVDWFVTHDKEHFLSARHEIALSFVIGTPGDLLQKFKDDFFV